MSITFNTNLKPSPDELFFDDYPAFLPTLTPFQILKAGVFGGTYFSHYSYREFIPLDWHSLPTNKYTLNTQNKNVNCYGILANKSREWWEERNLINHQYDTEGWFQWYCRFYYGRRCPDDIRQIQRWKSFKARHFARYTKLITNRPGNTTTQLTDKITYPKYKQSLMQWAIDPKVL